MGGAEIVFGEDGDEQESNNTRSIRGEGNEGAEGDFTEEDRGNDSDDGEDDTGNFDLPDDGSQRSLV